MKKGWFGYGKITSQELYESLPKHEKEILDKFKDYIQISASLERSEESIREVLRFRTIIGKPLNNLDLDDLRHFLKELKQSSFADHTKNKIRGFIQKYLRWGYKDWSLRFNEFEDIKFNSDAQRKKVIDSKTLLTEEDINKLLNAEQSLYWKTFLMCQSEGGLRTKEVRELKWSQVNFEDDGFTILNIPSKKNQTGTTKINPVVVKIAGNFLRELKDEQNKMKIKSEWVFPSPNDSNKPISKSVNIWFNSLCKKVLERPANNYLLRHSKGTQLQEKVRRGEMSKDNAITFMRHSEKMFDKTYSHMDKEDIKKLIKKQIYNTEELTKEENNKIKQLEKDFEKQNEKIISLTQLIDKTIGLLEYKLDPHEIAEIVKVHPEYFESED